jgi:hypothetical protein
VSFGPAELTPVNVVGRRDDSTWLTNLSLNLMTLAHAVLMETRIKTAKVGGVEVLRVSFLKTLNWVQGLWQFLELRGDLVEPKNVDKLVKRVIKEISQSITPKRRQRSSPRALRQPVVNWPRLAENSYQLDPT